MHRFVALVLIALIIAGCSGMTASLGYYDDDPFLRPYYHDYYDPYYFGTYSFNDCPRYYSARPLNCSACHYIY